MSAKTLLSVSIGCFLLGFLLVVFMEKIILPLLVPIKPDGPIKAILSWKETILLGTVIGAIYSLTILGVYVVRSVNYQ